MESGTRVRTIFGEGTMVRRRPYNSRKLGYLVKLDALTLDGETFEGAFLAFQHKDLEEIS